MEKFNLEFQWALYLEKSGLSLDTMHPVQRIETKRAFVAGMAQMFLLFGQYEDENTVLESMTALYDEIKTFWINETN